jgi:uncharacterized protein (DUF849 family)
VHLHVRDPENGRPIQDPGLFRDVLAIIGQSSDVVINLTTGGSPHMTVDERMKPAVELAPELASLNMGTMNFGRFSNFKHDWEREHLGNKALIFRNSFEDIERILKVCGDQGTRFEFECYDTSHLYNLAHFLERELVKPPLFIQSVVGLLGGIGADVEDLMHLRRTANRLFGDQFEWSVLGAGASQIRTAAVALGVGLEDSLWDGPGRLAESSRVQVERVRAIAEALHRKVATPSEARQRLDLRDS